MQTLLGIAVGVFLIVIGHLYERHVIEVTPSKGLLAKDLGSVTELRDFVWYAAWLASGVFAVCLVVWGLSGQSLILAAAIMGGIYDGLLFLKSFHANTHAAVARRRVQFSPKRMEALLQAWEEYELGSHRTVKRPVKEPGSVTEPWNIIRFTTLLTVGIVAVCFAYGVSSVVHSGGPEPRAVAAMLCIGLTGICWAVTLIVAALIVLGRAIRGNGSRLPRNPVRIPGGGGGVRDEWLDGPQATAVKVRPRRSAASG
jgi:hypothetical protein